MNKDNPILLTDFQKGIIEEAKVDTVFKVRKGAG